MKKFLLIALCLLFGLAIVSCKKPGKVDDLINGIIGELGGDDDDGDDEGDEGDPNNGGGQNDDSGTETENMKTQAEVQRLLGNSFLVTVEVTYATATGVEDAKMNVTLATDGNNSFLDLGEELASMYSTKMANGKWMTYIRSGDSDMYNMMVPVSMDVDPFTYIGMYAFVDSSITYTAKSNITFLDRACTKYEYNHADALATDCWIVDDQTGLILKREITAKAVDTGSQIESASASYEVIEFMLGSDVSQYFEQIRENVVVSEWDDEFYEGLGLQETDDSSFAYDKVFDGTNFSAADLDVLMAGITFDEEYQPKEYTVAYALNLNNKDGFDLILHLIEVFFDCGARFNYLGEMTETYLDDSTYLAYEDSGTMINVSFNAYLDEAGSASVSIIAVWNTDDGAEGWQISINASHNVVEEEFDFGE